MPAFSAARAFATPARRLSTCAALLIAGVLAGGLLTWHFRDPHTASVELLTGTVSWSNQETRLIAFHADGEPRDPQGDQTFYNVVPDNLNFPSCLVGGPGGRCGRTRGGSSWKPSIRASTGSEKSTSRSP